MKTNQVRVGPISEFPRLNTLNYRPVLLVVSAHPDDETFAVGGTLAVHAAKGWIVKLVCVTHGEQSPAAVQQLDTASYQKLRLAELRKAAKILGIDELITMNWGDGTAAQRKRVKAIGELLRIMIHTGADVVITFGPGGISGHPDHIAVSRFTTAAFNQYRITKVGETDEPRLYYVAHSAAVPADRLHQDKGGSSLPVTTIITDTAWSTKVAAMKAYDNRRAVLQQNKDTWKKGEESFQLVSPATLQV